MSVSIDKELLVRTIENSKKFNYVYDDVVIDGWTFKKVPVKKIFILQKICYLEKLLRQC